MAVTPTLLKTSATAILWDLDRDGYPAYFWPGALEDAPAPFQAGDYDRDDFDGDRH